jgi:hypothetical protein
MSWFGTRAPKPEFRLAGELKAPRFQRTTGKSARERRDLLSIGVIDDEPFQPHHNLENVGYKISLLGDPQTVNTVVPYQIILCDLQGVGQALDTRRQGAFLIREIKRNFPEKYVVAYTGGPAHSGISRESALAADAFLKKDADIETWTEKLDSIILELVDPYRVWMRQRRAFIDRDVDTLTIIKLEDAYVRSIANGSSSPDKSALAELVSRSGLPGDIRAIVQSFVSSIIFKVLIG